MLISNTLPDVTSDVTAENPLPLQWVGMEDISIPISMSLQDSLQALAAKADVFVSLESSKAKGIHMSRLYTIINQLVEHECNKDTIDHLLDEMIRSQNGICDSAKIKLVFGILVKKMALLSDEYGYQSYPLAISAQRKNKSSNYDFDITIPYSSTCPCSASLARQLHFNAINQQFPDSTIDKKKLLEWGQSEAGTIATPHSQRSYAYLKLQYSDNEWPDLMDLIHQLEEIIGTPVQTAVKRSDEQEFARLNAENLMFCEDAARRIKNCLEQIPFVTDYWFKVEHQESLHAHNAVVIDQKF